MWIQECKKSFQNEDLPLIPIVVNKNNNHSIKWVKIIYIESQNIYVGVVLNMKIQKMANGAQSICFDRGDILNKYRLSELNPDRYNVQLQNFKTSITEIKFSDNDSKLLIKRLMF